MSYFILFVSVFTCYRTKPFSSQEWVAKFKFISCLKHFEKSYPLFNSYFYLPKINIWKKKFFTDALLNISLKFQKFCFLLQKVKFDFLFFLWKLWICSKLSGNTVFISICKLWYQTRVCLWEKKHPSSNVYSVLRHWTKSKTKISCY